MEVLKWLFVSNDDNQFVNAETDCEEWICNNLNFLYCRVQRALFPRDAYDDEIALQAAKEDWIHDGGDSGPDCIHCTVEVKLVTEFMS